MPAPHSSRLQIDTSVATLAGPSSSHSPGHSGGLTPGSSLTTSTTPSRRMRSVSSASSSSSSVSETARLPNPCSAQQISTQPHSNFAEHARSSTESVSDESDGLTQDYVLAMHDFEPEHQNVNCLPFRAGQVIHVLNRHSSGWWDGELDGKRGWFPSNYVTNDVGLLTEEELPVSQVRSLPWLSFVPFNLQCSVLGLGMLIANQLHPQHHGRACRRPSAQGDRFRGQITDQCLRRARTPFRILTVPLS